MFVRAVRRAVWTRLRDDGDEAVGQAIEELTRKGTGVSVFECDSAAELELVAVALSAPRTGRQPFHYLEIERVDLEGIPVRHVVGTSPLPYANRLHREIDLSGDRARHLVLRLAQRRVEVKEIKPVALERLASRLRGDGQPIPAESWLLR